MKYNRLGASGLQVSAVGLGCMNFGMANDEAEAKRITQHAIAQGINLFDTADVYGDRGKSETWLGRALGSKRSDVIIATKFAGPMSDELQDRRGGSRRYIMHAVEQSLARLGTDYIDLYQMHVADEQTPIEETLRALDDLVQHGKVRYVGCSNFSAWQITDADWTARDAHLNRMVSVQNRYSLLTRDIEKEVVPVCEKFGLGILPYFPLESGLLTGKYRKGQDMPDGSRLAKWGAWAANAFASEDKLDQVEALIKLADDSGQSLLDFAMGWLANRPTVASVIAGVTSELQLDQNIAAALWEPTTEQSAAIDALTLPASTKAGPPGR